MQNGSIEEFIYLIGYGFEVLFIYKGVTYEFCGSWDDVEGIYTYYLINDKTGKLVWTAASKYGFPLVDFYNCPIWEGKTFWEVEKDIYWDDF